VISEEGDLVDTKTGKVINEFGATRFDVAVRALRGELDPAPWVEVRHATAAYEATAHNLWQKAGPSYPSHAVFALHTLVAHMPRGRPAYWY
jgi:hypothetical protein